MGLGNFLSGQPVIGGFFDKNTEKGKAEYAKALKLYEGLQLPDSTWLNYSPEDLQNYEEFNPEDAKYQTVVDDPSLLSDQASHLNALKQLAASGLSDEDIAGFEQASKQSAQQARGAREADLSNLQARGVAGSGMELLSKELANQQGAERARSGMMDQASAAAKQRALYQQSLGNELSGQRAADYKTAAGNADIINKFNQLNTGARNTATYNNILNRGNIANQNVGNRNAANMYNLEGRRTAAQTAYDNQRQHAGDLSGQYMNQAQIDFAQAEANRKKREALGKAAGTVVGGIFGGPAGAAGGGAIGGGIA